MPARRPWLFLPPVALLGCTLFPPPDATHVYACATGADCTAGFTCEDGGCVVARDAGGPVGAGMDGGSAGTGLDGGDGGR